MNTNEKEDFKLKLERKIKRLRSEIVELEEMTKPIAPENAIGRLSRMDAINIRGVNMATLVNAQSKLDGLEYALRNLNGAYFGLCAKCKEAIPPQRLLLVPESRFCVKCA